MCPYLVESTGFWGGFHKANVAMLRVVACAEGFKFGDGGVGAWDNGLADIDPARLVFSESIQRGVDDSGFRRLPVNDGVVGLTNFPALLHLAQQRGVLLAASHEEKAGGLAIKAAHEG